MRIARDVNDDRLELLIAAGFLISERVIDRLVELEVEDVYVEEQGTEDIVPQPEAVTDKTRRRTHKLLKRTFDNLQNLADMREIANEDVITILQYDERYANAVSVSDFHDVVHRTIEDLFDQHIEMFQSPLVKTYLDRSYEHAMNTAVLSVMLGRAFSYSREDLLELGSAAVLHDVGKLVLPGLADKPLRDLTLEEMRLSRLHPAAGAMLLARSSANSNLEQAAIRQHHEQQDGHGYPIKLFGTNDAPLKFRVQRNDHIFRFAEIITVANAFDNLLAGDLIVEAMPPAKAMESLVRGAGSLYNRTVVSKALELVNVYPVGAVVEIKAGCMLFESGMRGVVRASSGQRLKKPQVLVMWDRRGNKLAIPRTLDLNDHQGVEIELV